MPSDHTELVASIVLLCTGLAVWLAAGVWLAVAIVRGLSRVYRRDARRTGLVVDEAGLARLRDALRKDGHQ